MYEWAGHDITNSAGRDKAGDYMLSGGVFRKKSLSQISELSIYLYVYDENSHILK